ALASGGQMSGGSAAGGGSSGGPSSGGSAAGGTAGSGGSGAEAGAGGLMAGGAGAGDAGVLGCDGTPKGEEPSDSCRTVADCGPIHPVKCCHGGFCWGPEACPIPPANCATDFECDTDDDCEPNGTCVSTVSGCPQCEQRE